jgi:hypothetical protein
VNLEMTFSRIIYKYRDICASKSNKYLYVVKKKVGITSSRRSKRDGVSEKHGTETTAVF